MRMQELRFQGSEASNAVGELWSQELIALILYGDFIKIKNFCASKNTTKKIGKRKHIMGKNIYKTYTR